MSKSSCTASIFDGVLIDSDGSAEISCIALKMFHSYLNAPLRNKLRVTVRMNCVSKKF